MKYAIFLTNFIVVDWNQYRIAARDHYQISCTAIFLKKLGFSNLYNDQKKIFDYYMKNFMEEAKEDILFWCNIYNLIEDDFKNEPVRVLIPSSKIRVSEVYSELDVCSQVFDLKFKNSGYTNSEYYGAMRLYSKNERLNTYMFQCPVSVKNKFTVEEVDVAHDEN